MQVSVQTAIFNFRIWRPKSKNENKKTLLLQHFIALYVKIFGYTNHTSAYGLQTIVIGINWQRLLLVTITRAS
ncbi:hypothetical protein TW73_10960 [Pseudoalteromonas piscicida]|nr:hypothetical protein TW73_10960 [Pseudoalteromonas piscicida]